MHSRILTKNSFFWSEFKFAKSKMTKNDIFTYEIGFNEKSVRWNTTKLYEFMTMQQQSERFIAQLEAACERIRDVARYALYEDAVISVWLTSVYLRLLMQSIGTNVGCPQIVNLYDDCSHIDAYWDKCNKAFEVWKNITHSAPTDMNATGASMIRYSLLRQNVPLIDSLIEFLVKVKECTALHQLTTCASWRFLLGFHAFPKDITTMTFQFSSLHTTQRYQ